MKPPPATCRGFSLVELTLALGVAAFCLLSVLSLLPAGLQTNQITLQQTADTTLVRGIVGDLRATPTTASMSPRYGISIPATGAASHTIFLQEDGTISGTQDTDANPSLNPRYRATLAFVAPTDSSQKTATNVRILLTWPALADGSVSSPPTKYAGSCEVFTALLRN